MTWYENGRFYYAALLASDTPGHPAKSQTQTIFVMPHRTLHARKSLATKKHPKSAKTPPKKHKTPRKSTTPLPKDGGETQKKIALTREKKALFPILIVFAGTPRRPAKPGIPALPGVLGDAVAGKAWRPSKRGRLTAGRSGDGGTAAVRSCVCPSLRVARLGEEERSLQTPP